MIPEEVLEMENGHIDSGPGGLGTWVHACKRELRKLLCELTVNAWRMGRRIEVAEDFSGSSVKLWLELSVEHRDCHGKLEYQVANNLAETLGHLGLYGDDAASDFKKEQPFWMGLSDFQKAGDCESCHELRSK